MSFLNPAFLTALTLIGIPILIHLLRRKQIKVVKWAAMEFLRLSQEKRRRRLRIEELILLILRCLIVVSIVLAFARPVLRSLGIPLLSANARVYGVVVLDISRSMNHQSGEGKTNFARLQEVADTLFSNVFRPGDAVSIVLLSDKPEESVSAPSFDLNLLRQKIRTMQPSSRGTDYLEAARSVSKLLRASRIPAKEVYWITDDQASAWETSKREAAKEVWKEIDRSSRVTWVAVGAPAKERENIAVEPISTGTALVTPQLPARIEARIVNYGTQTHSDLLVHLVVEGKRVGSTRVALAPNGSSVAKFLYRFPKAGTFTGRVELANPESVDRLPADNSTPFAISVRDKLKVLVLDPRPTSDPAKSEAFYLVTAMAPGEEGSIAPTLREASSLGGNNLREFDAVIYVNALEIPASDQKLVQEYVKQGGGVLLFPGPETDAGRLNASLLSMGLLPANLTNRRALNEAESVTLNPASITHPSIISFKETSSLNVGIPRFTTYYVLEPQTDADPNAIQPMVRFSSGDAAFVERKVGQGKVILAASGAGTNWNQMPLKSSFLPFLYQMVSYLGAGPASRRILSQDETLTLSLPISDAGKTMKVTLPDGTTSSTTSALEARGGVFTYKNTHQAGIYRMEVEGGKTREAIAVFSPPTESNLTYADPTPSATSAGLSKGNLNVAYSPSKLQSSVQRSRFGAELWRPFLWLLLPMMLLESLLAQRFGRRT
jgi:hypothetical protein